MLKRITKITAGIILFNFLFLGSFSHAENMEELHGRRINLAGEGIVKGYTLKDSREHFWLGIFPNVFTQDASVRVAEIKNPDNYFPSEGRISDVFVYNVSMEKPRVLEKPLVVSLPYRSESSKKKRVHFFDRGAGEWKAIPTKLDKKNKRARAYIHFPFSYIAVLESDELEGPKKVGSEPLNLSSKGAALIDVDTGRVLFEKNGNQPYHMASLVKLMTAYTFRDINPDLSRTTTVSSADLSIGSRVGFAPGDVFSMKELLYGMMIPSGNDSARALAHASGVDYGTFITWMNNKAREMDLNTMRFTGVTGLERGNNTSAIDYALFSRVALDDLEMLKATTSKGACIGRQSRYCFKSTNKLLWSDLYITGGKTGYLPLSWGGDGASLMIKARHSSGSQVIGVVLGNSTADGRFSDMEKMIKWGYRNYQFE